MPNRRVAIQQLLLIWAGVALFPSCLQNEQKVSIPLKKIRIDPDDENMLAELAETILPKTDSPGAKDLSAHLFALKMVDDCYTKANQENYIQGMKDFESFVTKKTGKSFIAIAIKAVKCMKTIIRTAQQIILRAFVMKAAMFLA